jgi:hypothetical protein
MDENTTAQDAVIDVRDSAELTSVANPRRTQL